MQKTGGGADPEDDQCKHEKQQDILVAYMRITCIYTKMTDAIAKGYQRTLWNITECAK